jgi:hypothetical protein
VSSVHVDKCWTVGPMRGSGLEGRLVNCRCESVYLQEHCVVLMGTLISTLSPQAPFTLPTGCYIPSQPCVLPFSWSSIFLLSFGAQSYRTYNHTIGLNHLCICSFLPHRKSFQGSVMGFFCYPFSAHPAYSRASV